MDYRGNLQAKARSSNGIETSKKNWLNSLQEFYKEQCERVKESAKGAKATYFNKKIDECAGDQKRLFRLVDNLL